MRKKYFIVLLLCIIGLGFDSSNSHAEVDFYEIEGREEAIITALKVAKRLKKGSSSPIKVAEIQEGDTAEKVSQEKKRLPRSYEEPRIEVERAGFERYYVQGDGYKVTDFLGLSASIEIVEEPKKIDDMVLILGQEFNDFRGYSDDDLRAMTRKLFTRSVAGQAVVRYKDWPRLRYAYEEKDVLTEYINKDVNIWKVNEFDLLYGFALFERVNFLTLNPIYKRMIIVNEDTATKYENIDQYLLNYTIKPFDNWEIFGQQQYERNKNLRSTTLSKNKNRASRIELRQRVPEQKLGIIYGWYHGETKWMPGDTLQVKNEMYIDIGKNLTDKWRVNVRLEYDIDELQRVSNHHIKSDVFRLSNKFSYDLTEFLFVSCGLDFSDDLSSINQFDNISPYVELEYFKYGFLRWVLGYRHTEHLNFKHGFDMIYGKLFLFRF